jgi:class 3 adenylate cyclase
VLAKAGEQATSEADYDLLRRFEAIADATLRGRQTPIPVWALRDETAPAPLVAAGQD